jgi:hypothetical protein
VKNAVAASVYIKHLTSAERAALPASANDSAEIRYGIPPDCATPTSCVFGAKSSSKVIVLYGDSHARMWLPAIIPAAKAHGLKVVIVGEIGCPFANITLPGLQAHCDADRPGFVTTIKALKPMAIILSERTTYDAVPAASWQQAVTSAIQSFAPTKVAVIGDNQVIRFSPPQCLAAFPNSVQRCTEPNPNTTTPGQETAERAAAKAAGSLYVDPTPWLCTKTKCSPVISRFLAYWNPYHVSVTYAAYLATVMGSALKTVL